MEVIFRTYNSFNSSFFNLLSGETEVKQTTGLSLLLSKDVKFLSFFLNYHKIKNRIGEINLKDYSKVIINSEFPLDSSLRADIVLKFYKNDQPDFVILFEAKSIAIETNFDKLNAQLENYIQSNKESIFLGFKIFKGILTRNEFFDKDFITLTWNDIIHLLFNCKSDSELLNDYINFLLNIKGNMKFYDKEVYSIPAGKSHKYLFQEPFIYVCPNYGKYIMKKIPLFLTFRRDQGIMEKLFGLEEKIVLNPSKDLTDFYSSDYPQDIKDRIDCYIKGFWGENLPNERHQFFILSRKNQIDLLHHPKPPKNNAFRAYYSLSQLLDRKIEIVIPDK